MSIYSGFPTRKDQNNYNKLLSKLIVTLQDHVLHLLHNFNLKISQQKANEYYRILSKMKEYQQHKYLPPKFSQLMNPIHSLIMGQKQLDTEILKNSKKTQNYGSNFNSRQHLIEVNDMIKNKQNRLNMFNDKQSNNSIDWKQKMKKNSSLGKDNYFGKNLPSAQSSVYMNFNLPKTSNQKNTSHSFLTKNRAAISFNNDLTSNQIRHIKQKVPNIHIKNPYKSTRKPKTQQSKQNN